MTAAIATVLLLATLVQLAALVTLHVLPTGLSPIADPVSQYALTRFGAGYAIAAISAAVAGSAAALTLGSLPGGAIAAMLLWTFAAARAVIPAVPMDEPTAVPTRRGRLHGRLATVAFAAVTAASYLALDPLERAGGPAFVTATRVAATVMTLGAVGIVLCRLAPPLRAVFGIAERLIYVGFTCWFLAIAILRLRF